MFDQFEQPDVLINTALPVLPKTNLISNFPKELPRLDDLISQEFGKDLLDPKFATTTSTATTTTTPRSSRFSIVDGSSENVFDSKMRSSTYRDPMRLGDNNINILCANLSYKIVLCSFSLFEARLCNFFGAKKLLQKLQVEN